MDTQAIIQQLETLTSSAETLSSNDRAELLLASQKLSSTLISPFEATARIIFAPMISTAVRFAMDTKLFETMAAIEAESNQSATVQELAIRTGVDKLLVLRIIRVLAAFDVLKETGKDTFVSTSLSRSYFPGSPLACAMTYASVQHTVIAQLPEYFEKHGYKSPDDAFAGPFQFAFNTKQHMFEWFADHPKYADAFNASMKNSRSIDPTKWFERFPVEEKLATNPTGVALVDVAGGRGYDIIPLQAAHPELRGRLILQDLPEVISTTENIPAGIEAQAHDMFTPQPVKEAKAYFFHNILHDWPDKQVSTILSHTREAMSFDSILLIYEIPLSEEGLGFFHACMDISMMAFFSSLERTEKQYEELLERCGFELVKVWKSGVGSPALFEAKKKDL
jgi:hypothetical protein